MSLCRYHVMCVCWGEEVNERPSFPALKEMLLSLQSKEPMTALILDIDYTLPYYNLALSSVKTRHSGGSKGGDESPGNYWQRRDKVGMSLFVKKQRNQNNMAIDIEYVFVSYAGEPFL